MTIHDQHDSLQFAHPLVRDWFLSHIGVPTEPQQQGWPAILAGKTTLISAPTGSGKTLAAFLTCIDSLVRKAIQGTLTSKTEVLYVSPLKALSNDIHKNLVQPLAQIVDLAKARGLPMQDIEVAVRTGDTLSRERQAMLKNPPHILVTTPESLYILLTAERSRQMLQEVKVVIVDEIHALADDKRGAHLALSLERLAALTGKPPVRIGLSATQKPLTLVAEFLAGSQRTVPAIVDIGHARHLELAIEVPDSELGAVASNEMWDEIYEKISKLVQQNRSTLVFVNTRRLAERVAHHLTERLGEDQVAAHHGSLSRKLRLAAETKLKNGELRCLVATASLELGIDIGTIDLVCQIGSPRAIAVALQRVGRAGHWHGAISKGRIFATTRDELIECAALIYAIRTGDLDKLIVPEQPLDILAQQIVATCSTGDWREDDLFTLVRSAYPYRNLTRATYEEVLTMLSDGIAGTRGRYGAYLFRDRVNGLVKARRGARLTAITNGGAIPENGLFTVVAEPEEIIVGTLDEDFAVESNRGDIILLGTTSWQIHRIESATGRVLVTDAHGIPPSVPFWRGEAPPRTEELSWHVSELRKKVDGLLPTNISISQTDLSMQPEMKPAITWLCDQCGLDAMAAQQLIEYILQGRAVLGAVPSQDTIIAERFFDEGGGMQLIIHAPFGARINKAWGLALRKRFCRSFNFELQAAATDNGLNIALAEQHSFPLADVFNFLHPNSIKEVLTQAVLQSPLFKTRWRWAATRSLALIRYRGGKKIPPHIQRMLSDDLLAAVFPDAAACQDNLGGRDIELPDHPLINEVMKDALTEALDIEGMQALLQAIIGGKIQCLAIDTPIPSPFSHEILNANPYAFLDDAPLEERRARAVALRRVLPNNLQDVGKLDPTVIAEVQKQAWPDVRDADELHDALQTLIALPTDFARHSSEIQMLWQNYFEVLVAQGRAGIALVDGRQFWFAAEKSKTFTAVYPQAQLQHHLVEIERQQPEYFDAVVTMLRGWLLHLGPTTAQELSTSLNIPLTDIDTALLKLESTGLVLRGSFTPTIQSPQLTAGTNSPSPASGRGRGERAQLKLEWCERRLLARIHQLTLGILRKEIEPVTAAQFMAWLFQWQHVAAGTQLQGEHGLLEVIRQLQGFEIPANAWEKQVLAKRIKYYDPQMLDRMCLMGEIGWGRLSPHPATQAVDDEIASNSKTKKRVMPTSVAPITFFIRAESDWMVLPNGSEENEDLTGLGHVAKNIYQYLKKRGASFFADIVRGVGHLKSEVEMGLWELVAAGMITADGFDNLRALIDPHRRLDKHHRRLRPRHTAGRWSLLHVEADITEQNNRMEATCWLLLRRYGVVMRDLLAREKNLPRWRELLVAFRRLEDRGEIRGGRFVSGFLGEQFALPYAVESLRASKQSLASDAKPVATTVTISAVDPLNLVGILLPGPRVTAISGNTVTLRDGVPLLEEYSKQ